MKNFNSFIKNKKIKKYNDQIMDICKEKGYDILQIGVVESHQIFKIIINPNADRTICFVGGIHGDESAGPLGILKLLENFYVPKNKKIIIIPIVNPSGYESDSRENSDGIDINREFYKKEGAEEAEITWNAIKDEDLILLHTLHEDPGQKDFYLYYTDHKEIAKDLCELGKKYFNIKSTETLRGDKVKEGLIPLPHVKRGTIEDKIYDKGIPYITTESPGKENLNKRIEFNYNAIKMVIQQI